MGATHLDWLDTSGRVTQTVLLDVVPSALIQAWDTGHVLVVATRVSPWRARWYGADAAPLTGFFDVPGSANGTAILKLLVDGRVAVSDGGSWVGVIADGSITFEAPPGWLATRPSTVLATIRGGRAYAVHSSLFGTASDEVEYPARLGRELRAGRRSRRPSRQRASNGPPPDSTWATTGPCSSG